MKRKILSFLRDYWILLLITAAGIGAAVWFVNPLLRFYDLFTDRRTVIAYIEAWGTAAPAVFIGIQALQVFIAPLPGEISGLIGGYLFGVLKGFIYSSIGLTIGSMINFGLGRVLGKKFVRRLIPEQHLNGLDRYLMHQGLFIILVLFVVPGFPKDYMSLFLGVTMVPFRVFAPIATLGRMPGTLMLSLQGKFLFEREYFFTALVFAASVVLVMFGYKYRNTFYEWAERQNHR
ncbi:MAG: VTT domain-containing protein [Desulfobacteraceae bacterium]|nr:VTT domain-containing protein [Desulfobacteraceae bacterium]MCF8094368.1 VTT domain-containing protein [Desulfobacteraceae bacterium]